MNERVNEHGSSSRTIRIVIAALIVAVIIAVAIDNSESVEVGYVIGETERPGLGRARRRRHRRCRDRLAHQASPNPRLIRPPRELGKPTLPPSANVTSWSMSMRRVRSR